MEEVYIQLRMLLTSEGVFMERPLVAANPQIGLQRYLVKSLDLGIIP